jgi:predicted chitinase
MVTDDELKRIMPNLSSAKRALYLPPLQKAMIEFDITTALREAAFLAQIAHESAELRYMEEIWGPTQAQLSYEFRKSLGNTQQGDGKRFKGRGPIQLTGRANYKESGGLLGVDLIANPQLAATPDVAFRIAGLYWKRRGLNPLADQGTQEAFKKITKIINGGYNGLEDRQKYYARAKLVLSQNDPVPGNASLTLLVNGKSLPSAQAFLRGGRVMVALRPVAAAAGWPILSQNATEAVLQDAKKSNHRLPVLMQGNTPFVRLKDLPGQPTFDGPSHTATLAV